MTSMFLHSGQFIFILGSKQEVFIPAKEDVKFPPLLLPLRLLLSQKEQSCQREHRFKWRTEA